MLHDPRRSHSIVLKPFVFQPTLRRSAYTSFRAKQGLMNQYVFVQALLAYAYKINTLCHSLKHPAKKMCYKQETEEAARGGKYFFKN